MGTDIVPAMLTPGEFIMSRGAVNMFGADTLMAMNEAGGGTNRPKYGKVRGYQGGGYVFAKKMIQEHEGSVIVDGMHQAYFDSEGKPTIGYGHLIIPGDGYSMQSRISQKEADELFDKDFDKHLKIAKRIPGFDKAPPQQQAAAIDLTFNMGYWPNDFPNAAKAFAAGDFEAAANELRYRNAAAGDFASSLWYQQVGPRRGIPIVSLMRGMGIGDSPHLKGFEKLLPVSKSVDMMNPDLKQSSKSSMSTAPGSLGPAYSDDASMKELSKQQLLSDRLNSIRSKFSNPIDTFIRTPLRRAFPGTPNVPTETRNFVLPAVDSPKQNVSSSNQTNDVPTFSVVSGNKMRDLISKDLGIHDLAGVS
jgi:GH24 family phage-related lysozyme (muramidase)